MCGREGGKAGVFGGGEIEERSLHCAAAKDAAAPVGMTDSARAFAKARASESGRYKCADQL